jgi:hypothetical protein
MIAMRRLIPVLALLIPAVVVFVAAELVLSIMQVNTKANLRFMPESGGTFIPHAYYRHTKEGFSEGYFNSHGFRDYERSYDKTPGTYRILVLGDSFVEAFQVPLERSFTALLEQSLSTEDRKVEVLNLGQSGFGTGAEYLRYINLGVRYHPDLVILAFLTGNDFRNNSRYLDREQQLVYYTTDGHLQRDLLDGYARGLTLPKRLFQFAARHSYLASLISQRVYLLRLQSRTARGDHSRNSGGSSDVNNNGYGELSEFSDLNIYRPEWLPRWKEALQITKTMLLKFQRDVESRNSRFLLLSLTNGEQLHKPMQLGLREEFGIDFDFEKPDRILKTIATEAGMEYLMLLPVFQSQPNPSVFHGFNGSVTGHWNERGHDLAAKTLAQYLSQAK